ncbi:MAG: App1 family protein [Ferruginibacter sp.]
MAKPASFSPAAVKVYHGYGHMHDLVVYGHVLKQTAAERKYTNNILSNIIHLLRLFFIKPLAGMKVRLHWRNQVCNSVTEHDGFFKFEWASENDVPAGWHPVTVDALDDDGNIISTGEGQVFVPHITQYAFVSDIDDTVMVSHSATIFRRLRSLFTKNPKSRKAFADVVQHYDLLALSHTTADVPNPFFYVSSSEWNLYNDLVDFFRIKALPKGTFLLSQMKRWYQLLKTGKTKHEAKLIKVYRIMKVFPKQKFILFGDNSQADPFIYEMIARRYPQKIFAVYIRNVVQKNVAVTERLLASMQQGGIHTCLFKSNEEAISHSQKIGLIEAV